MRRTLRSLVRRSLTIPRAGAVFGPLMRNRATVFMLHRFRQPPLRNSGEDPDGLKQVLAFLRRERYELLDLEEVVNRLAGDGPPPLRAVAFTIDDGYADHAEVGAPVFREYDCPVTTFVTTGFLDGALWFWWDRIEYVFRRTRRLSFPLPFDDGKDTPVETPAERNAAQAAFTTWCKNVPDHAKHEAIVALAARAEVDLPAHAPPEYAPMSWDQLRRCEAGGMRFGPHTETHPVLSRVSDAQARAEINGSWARLRQQASRPVPVFCYPNGQTGDYGAREIGILRDAGFAGAVVGMGGYLQREQLQKEPLARFELPRIVFNSDVGRIVQYASGMDRFLDVFRREAS